MMGTNKKRYRYLEAVYDEDLRAVLFYGFNHRTDRKELISWYQPIKNGAGREDLYLLKSILTASQIKYISKVYNGFDREGPEYFDKIRNDKIKVFEVK